MALCSRQHTKLYNKFVININNPLVMEGKQINKKLLIRKVLKIVTVVVLAGVAQYYYTKNKSVGKELTALVTNYNSACPMMISNDIRMESVSTLPHNTIQY